MVTSFCISGGIALIAEELNWNHLCAVKVVSYSHADEEKGYLFPGAENSVAQLLYVENGKLHVVIQGRECLLNGGDLVIIGPGQWHMEYADAREELWLLRIQFECKPEEIKSLWNRKITAPRKGQMHLWEMVYESERAEAYYEPMIAHQLSLLLLTLLRQSQKENWETESPNGENAIILRVQRIINQRCREKLSVPLVAQYADVSPSYLTALFQKHLNISPGEYIRRVKLQESKMLIREEEMSFMEIAEKLQYSTLQQFSRQFKEKFGMTPSEYAKQVRHTKGE